MAQQQNNKNSLPSYSYGAIPVEVKDKDDGSDHHDQHQSRVSYMLQPATLLVENICKNVVDLEGTLAHSTFTLPPDDDDNDHVGDHHPNVTEEMATIPSEVANISKNLIGGGVLSLSGGIALYANSSKAAISAICYVIILGAVFGYFCLLIGKSCHLTHSTTYRECWERTVGKQGGVFVAVVNTLDPLLGIFANATILAQSLQLLLEGIMNIHWTVTECLLFITIVGILPLCLMKNLNALAPFSAIGMAAVGVALAAMIVRYMDGSYLPEGIYYDDISKSLQPKFGIRNRPWSTDALPFVCMVFTSFDMHYNSPRFYAELRNATIPRFGQTVAYSFGITAVAYFSIAIFGYLTFGEHSDSYILNNYSPKDPLATVSRLAIGLCALVSYPLNYIGVRDNCLDILGIADRVDTDAKLNMFTVLLLSLLTITSCFVRDLGLINSVGGGTTVTLVCFVLPALMFREGIRKHGRGTVGEQREVWLVLILMVVGVVLGILGVWTSMTVGA